MSNFGDKKVFKASVEMLKENGISNTLVMDLKNITENDQPVEGVIGMNKEFTAEEAHTYVHVGMTKLLNCLSNKIGRYLKFKVANTPWKYEGVTSLLCLLFEDAEVVIERTFVQKGTDLNGVPAKADMWNTSDIQVTFRTMTAEDNELAMMLLNDVKKRSTAEVKPLF